MIRHSIICDVCGVERKQANHWFTAQEHDGEFRIGAFFQSKSVRPGLRHLCGQTCLHRLVDDFLVRHMGGRTPLSPTEEKTVQQRAYPLLANLARETDLDGAKKTELSDFGSLTDSGQLDDFESSAVLLPSFPPKKLSRNSEQASELKVPAFLGNKRPATASKATKVSRTATASCAMPSQSRRTAGSSKKPPGRARVLQSSITSKLPPDSRSHPRSESLAKVAKASATVQVTTQIKAPAPVLTPIESSIRSSAGTQVVPPAGASLPILKPSAVPSVAESKISVKEPLVQAVQAAQSAPVVQSAQSIQSPPVARVPSAPPLRTIAGAWERARLWESRSTHQRQSSGKK